MQTVRTYVFLVAAISVASIGFALSIVPLDVQIRQADVVVYGKLEITRERGLSITWYPELKAQQKQTTSFHLGRIRASKVLKSDGEHEKIYDVAFASHITQYTNGLENVWLLHKDKIVARYGLRQAYPNSLEEAEKAIEKLQSEDSGRKR
jgi:hypothetical protein